MALESMWADAPEELEVERKSSPSKRNSNAKRNNNNNSKRDVDYRSSSVKEAVNFDNYRDKPVNKNRSPIRETINFDNFRNQPITKSTSPVRESINFDQYREKPKNSKTSPKKKTNQFLDDSKKKHTLCNSDAYYTPPSSRGKPSLELKKKSISSKEPVSPSKLDIIKKRIAEQQGILKETKHKEQQKQLLDDFLSGDGDINWEDD